MPELTPVAHVVTAADSATSHVAALAFRAAADGTAVLYASTGHDGALTAWAMEATGLTRIASLAYRHAGAGGTPGMAFVDTPGGPAILAGGGVSGPLTLVPLTAHGGFGAARPLGAVPAIAGDLVDPEVITTPQGAQVLFGGISGGAGLGRVTLNGTATAFTPGRIADYATTHADRVTALASVAVGGETILVTASTVDPGLTTWISGGQGWLNSRHSLAAAEGLWISGPTAMESALVDGRAYLVLASAGSGSLTVVEIGAGGTMTPRAHVLDDLHSRFSGVTALEVVTHHGLTYVIAGGADDGISLFLLLPGGKLVAEAHLADTTATGLANVAAIAATSTATGIEIVVASSSEPGLTRIRVETGPQGLILTAPAQGGALAGGAGRDLLSGGAGADSIAGGAGDDVIRDGDGQDRMAGGSGADLFVLARDGAPDTITDFTPGEDRLNLTAWPGLRDASQLTFTPVAGGLRLAYGDEVLTLLAADGRAIDPARLDPADLVGGTDLPVVAEPGLPGPARPDPDLPPPVVTAPPVRHGGAGADSIAGGGGADRLFGHGGDDILHGGPGDDSLSGQGGADRISGDSGHDRIDGGPGRDRLSGGDGDDHISGRGGGDTIHGEAGQDRIEGGGGRDSLFGGAGDDSLYGGAGHDRLAGGAGRDRAWGGGGRDRLTGGAGDDSLWGDRGNDVLGGGAGDDRLDGGAGRDRLSGHAGADLILGGAGPDRLDGGAGDDSLSGGTGRDRIDGGAGHDRIAGGTGADILTGGGGADVFVFSRGDGADRILDFGQGRDLLALDPLLWGGNLSRDAVVGNFAALARGGDAVLDFGRGDRIVLADFDDLGRLADMLVFL